MGPPYHVRPCLCFMLIDHMIYQEIPTGGKLSPDETGQALKPVAWGRCVWGVLNDTQTWLKVKAGRRLDVLETHNACGITGGITYVDHMNHTVDHRCISTSIISIFSSLFFSSLILVYSLCLNLPIYLST